MYESYSCYFLNRCTALSPPPTKKPQIIETSAYKPTLSRIDLFQQHIYMLLYYSPFDFIIRLVSDYFWDSVAISIAELKEEENNLTPLSNISLS